MHIVSVHLIIPVSLIADLPCTLLDFPVPVSRASSSLGQSCVWKNISACGVFDLTSTVSFTEMTENIPCTYSEFAHQQSCPRLSLTRTSVCHYVLTKSSSSIPLIKSLLTCCVFRMSSHSQCGHNKD